MALRRAVLPNSRRSLSLVVLGPQGAVSYEQVDEWSADLVEHRPRPHPREPDQPPRPGGCPYLEGMPCYGEETIAGSLHQMVDGRLVLLEERVFAVLEDQYGAWFVSDGEGF